jgi:glycosyltransferase involved in cell wall biosynthesis
LGCLVARNIINRGQGAVLRLGYDILLHHDADICVTMDADNQHRPEDIPALLKPLLANEADMVIGSRKLGSNMSKSVFRQSGLAIFNQVISRLLKTRITDCSSGFRAFKIDVIRRLHLTEAQYQSTELIIETVKKGFRITEVPVTIVDRVHGQSKKGGNLKYGLNFAKVILKTWWR